MEPKKLPGYKEAVDRIIEIFNKEGYGTTESNAKKCRTADNDEYYPIGENDLKGGAINLRQLQ
jgi:hypothetical protein